MVRAKRPVAKGLPVSVSPKQSSSRTSLRLPSLLSVVALLIVGYGQKGQFQQWNQSTSSGSRGATASDIPSLPVQVMTSLPKSKTKEILTKCSNVTKKLISRELRTGLLISQATNCPVSDAWLSDYLEEYPRIHNQNFIFLNFGCNKGFDSLRVAEAITHRGDIFDKDKWRTALDIQHPGACLQAFETNPNIRQHDPYPTIKRQVEVHCVEAMPITYQRLEYAANTTMANQHGLTIYNYALTGPNGGGGNIILFPNMKAGKEDMHIGACQMEVHKEDCAEVPSFTVDEFVAKHVDSTATTRIPYVSIDVEGFDFTIMKAAQQTLMRTDYLEFEFHGGGDWQGQNLKDAIDMLHDVGLYCYWSGRNQLWRITDCWIDVYGSFHAWSNVACVNPEHQPSLAAKMEQVFDATVEKILDGALAPPAQ